MTVLPGSLDYLYYNGTLDHIPYEAYEMGPVTPSGMAQMSGMGTGIGMAYGMNPMGGYNMNSGYQMNGYGMNGYVSPYQMSGSQYLQAAQQGSLYNNYTTQDNFVNRYNSGISQGQNLSKENYRFGENGKNFRESILEAASATKDTVSSSPNWIKGILAGGIMLTTLCMLFKGKKKPVPQTYSTGFLSKLNPKNWSVNWSKLNPKNWIKK